MTCIVYSHSNYTILPICFLFLPRSFTWATNGTYSRHVQTWLFFSFPQTNLGIMKQEIVCLQQGVRANTFFFLRSTHCRQLCLFYTRVQTQKTKEPSDGFFHGFLCILSMSDYRSEFDTFSALTV